MSPMSKDTEKVQHEETAADAAAHGPETVSLKEYLVRETLSDMENRLTADHHLAGKHDDDSR